MRCREYTNLRVHFWSNTLEAVLWDLAPICGMFEYLCSKGWRNKLNDVLQEWTNNKTSSNQFYIKYENGCTKTLLQFCLTSAMKQSDLYQMIPTKSGKWHVPQTNLAVRNGTLATWNKSKWFLDVCIFVWRWIQFCRRLACRIAAVWTLFKVSTTFCL